MQKIQDVEDSFKCRFLNVHQKQVFALERGYQSITEIAKDRIRRAAKKIKEESSADIDYGFRVYRLDSSNMQDVYYKPQDYVQEQLDILAENVKSDRTADDLLAQVMLGWGLPLSLKIEQVEVSGKKVFKVAENSLYACFDSGIDEDIAKAIAKDEPLRIVFKDRGFKNDSAKTNVKQLLKQLSPETEMKVI
jgi:adenine-specific DNA-methyltransferase